MTDPLEFLATEPLGLELGDATEGRERRELLIARRGGRVFGIFAGAAEGIVEWKAPAPLPGAKPAVLGLVSVRGRMYTVIDPIRLPVATAAIEASPVRFIVLLSGADQLGLAVERVASITEIFLDEIERAGEAADRALVLGHWLDGTERVIILNPELIFTAACELDDQTLSSVERK